MTIKIINKMARLLIGGCAFINLKTCPVLLLSCPGLGLIVAFIHDGVELYELSIVSFSIVDYRCDFFSYC